MGFHGQEQVLRGINFHKHVFLCKMNLLENCVFHLPLLTVLSLDRGKLSSLTHCELDHSALSGAGKWSQWKTRISPFHLIKRCVFSKIHFFVFFFFLLFCLITVNIQFSSVAESCPTLCNAMDCIKPTPRACSNSCRWCHPAISSSAGPFSSCLQSVPASGSFPMSQLFASCGQSTGVSASASVLPMNIQDWYHLGWTGLIPLLSKGLKSLLQHHSSKASILWCSAFFTVQLSHPYMTTGKTIALTRWTSVSRVMSLLFNMLSSSIIAFLLRRKSLLIS